MSDPVLVPALQQVTSDDHGPWVVVTCYIFLPLTVLVVAVRLVTRLQVARGMNMSDSLITFSMYLYLSEILLIASLAFAKASITFLLIAITPRRNVLLACYVLLGVVALWAVTSIFATAFQCDLPRPWDSDPGRCINQQALLVFIGIINIVTDIAVIPISFFLMRNIQVSPYKRWQVVGLFTIRIIVPIITILNLIMLKSYFSSSPLDKPWYAIAPVICSQIMLNLSIIIGCIPSLKRFLQDLPSGAMGVNITECFEMGVSKKESSSQGKAYSTVSAGGFASRTVSKSGFKNQMRGNMWTTGHHTDDVENLKHEDRPGNGCTFSQGHSDNAHKFLTQESTVERSESVEGLTDGIIWRSVDYNVEYEDRPSEASGNRPSPRYDASWHDDRNRKGDRISDCDIEK